MTQWTAVLLNRLGRWAKGWPLRVRYMLLGLVFAQGAPLGYFLLRCLEAGTLPNPSWLAAELAYEPWLYAYLLIPSSLMLGTLGWVLGKKSDLLRLQSMVDPLTGLLNRRQFDSTLAAEVARSVRYGLPLSLLLIDVDRLKLINDLHGHRLGDRALISVADAMRMVTRSADISARFGGDEFAVIAPSTSARAARELATRLRGAIQQVVPAASAGCLTELSVSIGVADLQSLSPREPTPQDLLEAADRAMYRAKANGRDRVEVFGNEDPQDAQVSLSAR